MHSVLNGFRPDFTIILAVIIATVKVLMPSKGVLHLPRLEAEIVPPFKVQRNPLPNLLHS